MTDKNQDRRNHNRIAILTQVKIKYNHGLMQMDAMLRNISGHGALVESSDTSLAPDDFMMEISDAHLVDFDCQVMWRQPGLMGIKFS